MQKKPQRQSVSSLSLYSVFAMGCVLLSAQSVWAAGELTLDPDAYYEVTFQTSQSETRTVKSVKVVEVAKIAGHEFLVIEPTNVPQKARGYVAFERVSAILPTFFGGTPIVNSESPPQR